MKDTFHEVPNKNRNRNLDQQEYVRRYTYLDSEQIYETLAGLASDYPNLVTLDNSQEKYGLEAAGLKDDCPFDRQYTESGCLNWFITIEDKISHPEGSESYKRLPEVFLSGALHGDERIGPTTVVETAALLLNAADCESYPHGNPPTKSSSNSQWSQWETELQTARSCRNQLSSMGITPFYRKWLARLVTTRRIIVLPTANAQGYFQDKREEMKIDPNRDFPFDLKDSTCMRTIAGRTINEIFREHMFQLSLTFHAGMTAIGYEWGAPSYSPPDISPDDNAQKTIARGYAQYAGKLPGTWEHVPKYPFGTMNEIVYPVRGGMEDWAYAASWDKERTSPCHPNTFGGYPSEKTVYEDGTLRMFNMLVETSKRKTPNPEHLGTTLDLFSSEEGEGMGHISRNIRLALLMIDVAEPYIFFTAIENQYLQDDIVPLADRTGRRCMLDKVAKVEKNTAEENGPTVQWTVGGGFDVTETGVIYAKWEDIPKDFDGSMQPTPEIIDQFVKMNRKTVEGEGRTRWNVRGAFPPSPEIDGPNFAASIDLSDFNVGDQIAVIAFTMLDQEWRNEPKSQYEPKIQPQSHLVNARTNPDWYFESAGKIIQGRDWWFSTPLTMQIIECDVENLNTASIVLGTRFPESINEYKESVQKLQEGPGMLPLFIFMLSGATISILGGALIWKRKRHFMNHRFSFKKLPVDQNPRTEMDSEDGVEDGSLEMTESFTIT